MVDLVEQLAAIGVWVGGEDGTQALDMGVGQLGGAARARARGVVVALRLAAQRRADRVERQLRVVRVDPPRVPADRLELTQP